PWEPPEEVVEAPVLEVDDDDVLDLAEALGTLCGGRHDAQQGQHDGRERDAGQLLPLDTSHGDASVHPPARASASSYRATPTGRRRRWVPRGSPAGGRYGSTASGSSASGGRRPPRASGSSWWKRLDSRW